MMFIVMPGCLSDLLMIHESSSFCFLNLKNLCWFGNYSLDKFALVCTVCSKLEKGSQATIIALESLLMYRLCNSKSDVLISELMRSA